MIDSILENACEKLAALRDDLIAKENKETTLHLVAFVVVEHKGQKRYTAAINADGYTCLEICGRLKEIVRDGGII